MERGPQTNLMGTFPAAVKRKMNAKFTLLERDEFRCTETQQRRPSNRDTSEECERVTSLSL